MNRRRLALVWLISSAALAALTAWGVLRWHVAREHRSHAEDAGIDSEERFHAWTHEHLRLTVEQAAAMDTAEESFAATRRTLRDAMRAANGELRAAVLRDRSDSPAVRAAVQKLAASQAALQQATLAHLFSMAAQLDPERREKLIQWTYDSLKPVP